MLLSFSPFHVWMNGLVLVMVGLLWYGIDGVLIVDTVRVLMGEAIAPAAALLVGFFVLERYAASRGVDIWSGSKWAHVPFGVLLGLVPGCGGALAMTMAWSTGRVYFGAWVATLSATMGDAALPLIAQAPQSFVMIAAVQVAAALLSRYVIDMLRINPVRPIHLASVACCVEGVAKKADTLLLRMLVLTGWVSTVVMLGGFDAGVAWEGWLLVMSAALLGSLLWNGAVSGDEMLGRVQTVALWVWGLSCYFVSY